MDKKELREQLRLRRNDMGPKEIESRSRLIANRLIADLDWSAFNNIHIYRPISSLSEIDTAPLLEFLASNYPAITSVVQSRSRSAPTIGRQFDLIIVPTLGFDERCNRLGWGGGWYDRFLAGQPRALKIGLAYKDSLIAEGLPIEPHDVALDKIVTEDIILKR